MEFEELFKFLTNQPCRYYDDMDCFQTSRCVTEYCNICAATVLYKQFKGLINKVAAEEREASAKNNTAEIVKTLLIEITDQELKDISAIAGDNLKHFMLLYRNIYIDLIEQAAFKSADSTDLEYKCPDCGRIIEHGDCHDFKRCHRKEGS